MFGGPVSVPKTQKKMNTQLQHRPVQCQVWRRSSKNDRCYHKFSSDTFFSSSTGTISYVTLVRKAKPNTATCCSSRELQAESALKTPATFNLTQSNTAAQQWINKPLWRVLAQLAVTQLCGHSWGCKLCCCCTGLYHITAHWCTTSKNDQSTKSSSLTQWKWNIES